MGYTQREEVCSAARLPSVLREELEGYNWARDNVGQSGAAIYHLYGKTHAPELYLKYGKSTVADDIASEMVRLSWLAACMPLPAIAHFTRTADEAWLLTTAMPGRTVYQMLEAYPDARIDLVDALAEFLRRLHAVPVSSCPFNSGHIFRLALAQQRINAGLVDADDFDEERQGWAVEQVWEEMHTLLPFSPELVVTHGDFSLDNLLVCEGRVIGCIDVGQVGIADRYQDLSILWRGLGKFSPSLQERLFQQYGIPNPDWRKLQFHLMLDEFF
ncbi:MULTISPECIES: APH(3')-I family aminoglycoside O-phosphotransferase [unclassified Haematospirillum]|uniref:APH(3')-I family aminoglycoside O-phosphotransferase n=1 Tax=unclassified Haematospirillum TaxID=2622088 RepID=UPI00143A4D0F|nr:MULTISPECIES: APH(3')-I family aminoglycoside O-phosphotransferase [unclassified Haematospirillum]NKD54942.1 APH(3')-I family aminoglycoside O-phosphotransferase [Haematospirillum sp. H4890]NKD74963.1 APH(3')-I family aminoglycoside O-phosphotransferase [Haematospirillum sp. H4485]